MRPNSKPEFKVISEPLRGEEAEASKKRLRELLAEMAMRASKAGLTEEKVMELLKNGG